jgi:predicted lipoprotein
MVLWWPCSASATTEHPHRNTRNALAHPTNEMRSKRRARGNTRALALFSSALVIGIACRTHAPEENYYDGEQPSSGGRGVPSGGRSTTEPPSTMETGGDSQGASAGSQSAPGGEGGAAGASVAAEGGVPGVEPPSDCVTPPLAETAFSKEALRRAALECASFQLCQFQAAASSLESAVKDYVAQADEPRLAAAKQAWKLAMGSWSRLELFQFGPLASRSVSAGKDGYQGQGLRDAIYGWPAVARCRVEDQVAAETYASKGMSGVLTSARGLYALEYSLFFPEADTACAASSTTAMTWASLELDELRARKVAYAEAVALDVRERAGALIEIYAAGAAYEAAFVNASGYPSEQESLNVLGWALSYIEREVKDYKLGVPAGYTLTHPVGEPESPYAGVGTDNLRQNLLGFRALFQGCGPAGEGLGFDDWLTEAGHPELAADIIAAWQQALAAVEVFPALATASAGEVQALHAKFKALTDLMKAELFGDGSPLGLKLPEGLEGDTD